MNKAQSQAQARTVPVKPTEALAKAAGKVAASAGQAGAGGGQKAGAKAGHKGVRSGQLHHGKVAVAAGGKGEGDKATTAPKAAAKPSRPAASKTAGSSSKAAARKVAGPASKTRSARAVSAKAVPAKKPAAAPVAQPDATAQTSAAAVPAAATAPASAKQADANGPEGGDKRAPAPPSRLQPVATRQVRRQDVSGEDTLASADPLAAMAKASRRADEASNEDKLALALATRPVHEAVAILAEAGVGMATAGQAEGQSRTFRDDPSLDRRIIEGMLDDKDSFLDAMHRQGFGRDAVVRRAAELGLSEALIRQVKGVAADLAGERPGRRPTPSSLGARTCLSCDRVFFSSGPGNRLCTRCRGGDAGLAQL